MCTVLLSVDCSARVLGSLGGAPECGYYQLELRCTRYNYLSTRSTLLLFYKFYSVVRGGYGFTLCGGWHLRFTDERCGPTPESRTPSATKV